jgi:multiple sugar transport system substrate-binding protein
LALQTRSRANELENASRWSRARTLVGALALAGVILATACTPRESDALELWAAGREGEVVAELIRGYEAAHPGMRVRVQQLPFLGAHEKLLTAVVGESTPDVAQLGNTWLPEFAMIGSLEPLDARVSTSDIVDDVDYYPGAWDTSRYEGHSYGVPWYVDTRVLYYRRDLFEQAGVERPPTTWREWIDALTALQALFARHGQSDRLPIVIPFYEHQVPVAFGLQQGEPLLRDGDRYGNFRSVGFRRALEFYVNLFQSGLAPRVIEAQIGNKIEEFARGRIACFVSGPWEIAEIERRFPPEVADSWSTAPLPGPSGPGSSLALGSSLVVFAASKKKAAAWQLIEYLSRPDVQRRFYELTGDLPPRRSTWTQPGFAPRPQTAAFREQLERMVAMPPVPEWERIANEVVVITERAARGVTSIDAAVAELDARADRILEKRRWLLERRAKQGEPLGAAEPEMQ